MATAPDPHSTTSAFESASKATEDFGANDWLIEQMYEQYTADPKSVDPSWAKFFAANGAPGSAPAATSKTSKTVATAPAKSAPPTPAKPASANTTSAKPTSTDGGRNEGDKPTAVSSVPPGAAQPAPTGPDSTHAAPARPKPASKVESKTNQPARPATGAGLPADPPNPADRPAAGTDEPSRTVMRGAPMRTAKNMDASLTVPTATSVRSLPVKLLVDQRIVINNHLRRARGG